MHARQATGTLARRGALLAALLALGACSHLHWPWHKTPPPPPAPVHALDITGALTPAQYWKRNTLLIDLSAASGTGRIVLAPAAGSSWPVRLAFRVTPGAVGVLEVHGAARSLLPISSSGTAPVDLELTPGLYTAGTAQLTVSWGQAEPAAP